MTAQTHATKVTGTSGADDGPVDSSTAHEFGSTIRDLLADAGGNARTIEELDAIVEKRSDSSVLAGHRTRFVEAGLPGLLVPESSGGLGVLEEGEAVAALAAVARSAGAVPGPDLAGPWAVAPTVLRLVAELTPTNRENDDDAEAPADSADRAPCRNALLSRVAAGETQLAVADLDETATHGDTERGGGPDERDEDAIRLLDADDADGILVLAPGRITLVQNVPLAAAPSFDPTRPVSTVRRSRLGGGEVIAEGPAADTISAAARALGRVVLAAELHGTGQELLRLAVEHLQTRMAFGRPLGSFQALKHRAADIWSELSLVGSLVDDAAARLETALEVETGAHAAESGAYAAAALSFAADAVVHAGEEVLQMHGGTGYTWESPVHILLKRAVATRARWGTPHELRQEVARTFDL